MSPGHYSKLPLALGFGKSKIFASVTRIELTVLKDGMRPTSTGHWAMSSVNVCVFEPGDAGQLCLPSYGIFS